MPLELTAQQETVWEALKSNETDEYPLSAWYLGALYALDNHYNPDRVSQAAQSLRELLEKLPRVFRENDAQGTASGFAEMRRDINTRILEDKKRYHGGWIGKEIDSQLDKTLKKVDRYFELNRPPTRKEQIQQAVATIDPMADQFNSVIRQTKWERWYDLRKRLEGFAHHNRNPDIKEFREYLKTLERIIFDLLAPITAQDQHEIQSILNLSDRSASAIERMLSLIERRGANFVFFFKRVTETADAAWIPILDNRGYFANPPNTEPIGDGRVNFPFWWPIRFLANMSNHAPDEVIEIVSQLPEVDNPKVYDDILDIALRLHGEQSTKLKPKILEYTGIEYQWYADRYADLLAHWTAENQIQAVLELLQILIKFVPDPQSEYKQAQRKENPDDWTTSQKTNDDYFKEGFNLPRLLEPIPRFDEWKYVKVLEKGVRPLIEKEPLKVACILIDATADMIRLHKDQDELDKGKDEDASEIWWPRLDEQDSDYQDAKTALIHALTFASEKVYETSPGSIGDLDKVLRKQRWKIFRRLRQHLYVLHPNEQTKPWIRELILNHGDYARWEYPYEFQRMIRIACEHFGTELLTEEERTAIFNAIRSGPSKTNYRESMGDQFTEELFIQRQWHFQRMQFKPFASVLFGEYATYFQELEIEADKQISDETYSPVICRVGTMSSQSPRSQEELENLPDEELLTYTNEWQEEHHDKDDWLVEINIAALAEAFQTVFSKSIIPDASRLKFWLDNCERIERPIYIRAMVDEMKERVKAKTFDKLKEWLMFCEWVLSHPDQDPEEGAGLSDESREHPYWHSSRRAVGDFIGVCIEKDVPISAQKQLAKLLETLCTQFDWRLDRNKPVLSTHDDQLTEAFSNTRSRALRTLVDFGFWLRRHDPESNVSAATAIFEKRFAPKTEHPLSLPERAILGQNYRRIFNLDEAWATEHKSDFFPRHEFPAWMKAFDSFICFNNPFKPTFEILRDDFDFALEHLDDFKEQESFGKKPIETLGQHLFTYYLWGVYPLNGEESLLERYYRNTDDERAYWANLFDYEGKSLSNSGKALDATLHEKIIEFFDWRLEVGEPTELQEFFFWLKAECLDAKWRLQAYSRILDICISKNVEPSGKDGALEILVGMLADHTTKVVECFAKFTDCALKHKIYIVETDNARTILKAGLNSSDENMRKNAKRARENLLRVGHFDFLDMED